MFAGVLISALAFLDRLFGVCVLCVSLFAGVLVYAFYGCMCECVCFVMCVCFCLCVCNVFIFYVCVMCLCVCLWVCMCVLRY